MTLSFSTTWPPRMAKWAGNPNYFVEKIWTALTEGYREPGELGENKMHPKLHTIRHDPHDRWKAGILIHPVINNRTPHRFQFAPEFPCAGVQSIKIKYNNSANPWMYFDISVWDDKTNKGRGVIVSIDNKILSSLDVLKLAINDGFESLEQFFAYFNEDFEGKLIHWTDLRY